MADALEGSSPPGPSASVVAPATPRRNGAASAGLLGGGAVLAALAKGKGLLLAVKALSLGKLLLTFGSMFTTILFYASSNGWAFGAGFVLLLLIHELGHATAIRAAGLEASYPVFIPGFGALIALKGQPRDARVEAEIAIAGPVAGAVASLATAALYLVSRDRFFLALASFGFMLNLFNMTPLSPLDGGRVAKLFSRRAWVAGVAILVALFVVTQTPMLILIGVMAVMNMLRRGRAPRTESGSPEGGEITSAERRAMAVRYFGLCAVLAAGYYFSNRLLAG